MPRGIGHGVLQIDEEAAPRVVADRQVRARTDGIDHALDRVVGLGPAVDAEQVVVFDDPGRLEGRDHQARRAVERNDQHRQALQWHGLVSDQPGKIGSHRQEHRVDAIVGHGGPNPIQTFREHGREATAPGFARSHRPLAPW